MRYTFVIILICSVFTLSLAQTLRNEFAYSAKSNFEEQIVYVNKIDSVSRYEKTVIMGNDSKIPFYHYINIHNKNRFIILLHGLGSSKDKWVSPRPGRASLVDSLVSHGYNVIIPDARFHGERSYEFNFRPANTLPPGWSKSQKDARSLCEIYSSTIKDIRIIMDYFVKQHVNEKLQFDLIGSSMGGAIALIVNAVDPRVNSVVAIVPPVNRPISEIKDFGWPTEVIEAVKDISPMYYASLQKSPTTLLMGRTDFFTSEQEAKEFYDRIPLKDKNLKFYEAGHSLPPESISDVVEWIIAHNKK